MEDEVVLFAAAVVGWARTVSRWCAMRVFVGQDYEEREVREDGNLGYAGSGDGLD